MERTRNLCAHIPESLHAKVRTEQEASGKTLSQYVEMILKDYYEKGSEAGMEGTRTLAFQLPAEMFDALEALIKRKGLKKKEFMRQLIQRALDEAESEA
ncbi:4-oxalocrotonate tautomerase [Pseudoflavonifractor phocaeensis]|uniref:4-oxalocrotonate tautomerase n=1 Tax=Pseudoflavonifractor phocaeensis TaxID=1870988 RepID=UPI00210953A6|nr:4-oxalocrotonate tautomerase [Pseudoflavonifractor phocaeensis]MCQ4863541.1 4-oxalocrotonate tautomerase [Pseudoflavonifractor phocaeensis]